MKSGSPSRTTAAHKQKLKFQAWSSLVFHCCHSSFNPSEAPPWDSRPVSGAGVVHYQLLHRPRSVPTALGPAPLVTYPHRPSQAGGVPTRLRSTPPLPPLPGGARQGGRGVPGGKDRRGERKGDGRMRSDRDETVLSVKVLIVRVWSVKVLIVRVWSVKVLIVRVLSLKVLIVRVWSVKVSIVRVWSVKVSIVDVIVKCKSVNCRVWSGKSVNCKSVKCKAVNCKSVKCKSV